MVNLVHDINFKYCNNIDSGDITIRNNSLNIKYGINGTGKSTIAKAIKLSSDNKALNQLLSFSQVVLGKRGIKPTISSIPYQNVMVFDGEYLKQFVYQKTNLLKDTFEVLIKSEKYTHYKDQIDREFINIRSSVRDELNIAKIKEVLGGLCQHMVVTNEGKLSRKTSGVKSILDDGKGVAFKPPESLSAFDTFFQDKCSTSWAVWKLKGINEFGEKGICPFCAEIESTKNKAQSLIFQQTFDEKSINYANKLREYLISITDYINPEKMEDLLNLLSVNADRDTLELKLVRLGVEASYLHQKIERIASFDGYSIDQSNMELFEKQFTQMKISALELDYFNTEAFIEELLPINDHVDKLIEMISKLKSEVSSFSKILKEQISGREEDINAFLKSAGYRYSFNVIVDGDNSAHAVLSYGTELDGIHELNSPDNHLSWGEKNALALLLFMFDAISKDADLIILDDPISSFDSNKKYAIINRLFKTGDRANSLYLRTVLMLTHDFEPVIDYVQVGGKLSGDSVIAHYLQNQDGILNEKQICKNQDMLSIVVLMKELAEDEKVCLPVRIGCMRKYIEHTVKNPKKNMGYNILSSFIHGRQYATYDFAGENRMTNEDYEKGCDEVKDKIADFDYSEKLILFESKCLLDFYTEEKNDFFKLLILRAYIERNPEARIRLKDQDDVLRKYVDETYHIENDYLYSLDVRTFNIVPSHYIVMAKTFVESEKLF